MYIIDVKVNGLKINMKIGVSIQCFRRRPQQVALWRWMFWLWQIKIANDVYFQVNAPRSLPQNQIFKNYHSSMFTCDSFMSTCHMIQMTFNVITSTTKISMLTRDLRTVYQQKMTMFTHDFEQLTIQAISGQQINSKQTIAWTT